MKKMRSLLIVIVLAGVVAHSADQPEEATPMQTNGLGMRFVPVPGTQVEFSVYETRVRDFRTFVRETGYVHMRESATADSRMLSLDTDGAKPRGHSWEDPGFAQTEDHPVVGVNWRDAKAFCEWLTLRERAAGRLSAERAYRLPTDHEWSMAVGLDEEDPKATPKEKNAKILYKYPWGEEWPKGAPPPNGAGNVAGEETDDGHLPANAQVIKDYHDGFPRTAPVGSFPANRHGIFDLSGNVSEWCEDEYDPKEGTRVLRGASWLNFEPRKLLSSYRRYDRPGRRNTFFGFRCVIGPPIP